MIKSASRSSIANDQKYRSMLAGTVPSSEYLIESRVLDTAVDAITFDNLAQYAGIYKHLQIVMVSRVNQSTARDLLMRFNGVDQEVYAGHRLLGNGSSVVSNSRTFSKEMFIGFVDGDQFTAAVIDILDVYATKNKTVRSFVGAHGFAREVMICSGLFINTGSINSITLFPGANSYVAGSRFSLYGVTA